MPRTHSSTSSAPISKRLSKWRATIVTVAFSTLVFSSASSALAFEVDRLSGSDRYETCAQISQAYWPLGADSVVLATGVGYADALTGVPLAAKLQAPLLLTDPDHLGSSIKNEIIRLKAVNATILGGNMAITPQVEMELEEMGLTTTRIEGANRFETSAEITRIIQPSDGAIYVATGADFPDALAVSAIAAVSPQTPIMLVQKRSIPKESSALLSELSIDTTIVVGGTAVIDDSVVDQLPGATRVAGANRYDTAKALAMLGWLSGMPMADAFIVSGVNYPDAMSIGAAAGKLGAPILLSDPLKLSPESGDALTALYETVQDVRIIGGQKAVSSSVGNELRQLNIDLSK